MAKRSGWFMAGMLAFSMAWAANAQDGAENLPNPTDPDTGLEYPLTADQKRVLNALVIKCQDETRPEIAAESCSHVVDEFVRKLKVAPPAGQGPSKGWLSGGTRLG